MATSTGCPSPAPMTRRSPRGGCGCGSERGPWTADPGRPGRDPHPARGDRRPPVRPRAPLPASRQGGCRHPGRHRRRLTGDDGASRPQLRRPARCRRRAVRPAGRRARPGPGRRRPVALADRGARTARVAATLAFLAGLVNLVSAAMPAERVRLRAVRFLTPDVVSDGAVVAVAALGVALMLLAGGLRRRNRLAWAVTVALLAASAVFHLVKGLDVVEAVVQAALAGWLLGQQRWFTARPGPRERRRVLGPALAVVLTTTAVRAAGARRQRARADRPGRAGPRPRRRRPDGGRAGQRPAAAGPVRRRVPALGRRRCSGSAC